MWPVLFDTSSPGTENRWSTRCHTVSMSRFPTLHLHRRDLLRSLTSPVLRHYNLITHGPTRGDHWLPTVSVRQVSELRPWHSRCQKLPRSLGPFSVRTTVYLLRVFLGRVDQNTRHTPIPKGLPTCTVPSLWSSTCLEVSVEDSTYFQKS